MRFHAVRLTIAILAIGSLVACGGGNSVKGGGGSATLSSISVAGATASVDLAKTDQFTATGHYSDSSTKDLSSTVTWASSASSTASISSSGLATAVAAGTTNITATSGSVTGTASLTVNGPSSLTVTPIGPTVSVGAVLPLKATGNFSDSAAIDLTSLVSWTSSASGVASVSGTGSVTGAAAGIATITATLGKITASTPVSVTSQSAGPGSLKNSYAFFLKTIDSRGQGVIVGSFTSDGSGNITGGMADYNLASGVSTTAASLTVSNYNVLPDGRGEADIKLNSTTFHVAFVLSDFVGGVATKGKMISFDNNIASGEFELQTAGANLNASYVFGFNGLDASNKPEAQIGWFSTTSSSGFSDVNDNGVIDGGTNPPPAADQTLSPVTISAVSTGNRGTATLGTANYAFYTISASKAYFIETDSVAGSTALAGVAEQQTTVQPLSAENPISPCDSLGDEPTCNYAFLLNHAASADNGTFERAGQLNFCKCSTNGGIEYAHEDDSDGTTWTVTAGTRPFDTSAPGRGVLHYTVANSANPGGVPRYAIVYPVSRTVSEVTTQAASRLYMMDTDTTSPGVGTADFIDVDLGNVTTNPMPAAGTYVFSATNIGNSNLLQLGLVTFDSSGNATGISYINNNGTLSAVPVSGVFTPTTDTTNGGNGLGTISPFNGITSSLTGYNVGSKGLIVLNSKSLINGRLELQ